MLPKLVRLLRSLLAAANAKHSYSGITTKINGENVRRLGNLFSICVNTCAGLKRVYLKTLEAARKTNGEAGRSGIDLTDGDKHSSRPTQINPQCGDTITASTNQPCYVETDTFNVVTL